MTTTEPQPTAPRKTATDPTATARVDRGFRNRRLVAAYLAGATQAEVAAEFGLSGAQVSRILRDAGVRRRRGLTPGEQAAVVDQWLAGEPVAVLAWEFGVSRAVIERAVAGVRPGEGPARRALPLRERVVRDRAIAERYRSGETQVEIASEFGLSHSQVSRILRRVGVPIRNRPLPQVDLAARNRLILARYSAGVPQAEIGDEFGISQAQVSRIVIRAAGRGA